MISEGLGLNYKWVLQYVEYPLEDCCRAYRHHMLLLADKGSVLTRQAFRAEADAKVVVRLLNNNSITGWVQSMDEAHPMFSFINKSDAMRLKLLFTP